ncbi:IclR family transcriptional regulator [Marinobacter mangrovi]|uniref:IclR family transcriptional regulator n=1 Tax=Marinobacter mangrovi TaxID=2803918 RepID=UPI0019338FC3|nr:IclR family transcriptional regulator [Marinobacter mangrovi]
MSSIDKAIQVLETVCDNPEAIRFTDLVARLGLPKSTAHRLLTTLLDHGLVRYDREDQRYSPGYRLLSMAQRTWERLDIPKVARDHMQRLLHEAGETVHLAAVDGHEIIYIDKLESPKTIRLYSAIGKRGPMYCTGVGKAILAYLPEQQQEDVIAHTEFVRHTAHTIPDARALRQALADIRVRGCALDMEEHEEGVRCVAAPIFNFRGEVVAGISVTSLASRMSTTRLQDLQSLLLEVARDISRELGYLQPTDHSRPGGQETS